MDCTAPNAAHGRRRWLPRRLCPREGPRRRSTMASAPSQAKSLPCWGKFRLNRSQTKRRSTRLIPVAIAFRFGDTSGALVNDETDLVFQRLQHLLLGDSADNLSLAENHAFAVAGGETDVGIAGFAGTVHDATHHGDADWLVYAGQKFVDLICQREQIDLDATAGRARDHRRALLPQLEALQDLVGNEDFFHRIGGERDTDGVADAKGEKRADPGRGAYAAGPGCASLRHAEVQWIVIWQSGEAPVSLEENRELEGFQTD